MAKKSEKKSAGVSNITERLGSGVVDSSQRKAFLKVYTRRNQIKPDVGNEGLSISMEADCAVSVQKPKLNSRFQDNLTFKKRKNGEVSVSNDKICSLSVANSSAVGRRSAKKTKPLEHGLQVQNFPEESSEFENDGGEREWWAKEKKSFAERVKSFIFKMQLVQGERKFCQWKGSVMDSIGGAYLTQNVNDVLSSSAFMSLAARYPHQAGTQKLNSKNASCYSSTEVKTKKLLPRNGTCKGKEPKTIGSLGVNKGKSKEADEKTEKVSKRKRMKKETDVINWANLRKLYSKGGRRKKTYQVSQSVDWDAVRMAEVYDISKAIEKRGMNNNLAARIKNCLNVLANELGNVDLEWLRDVPPHKAKEYLLSIPGMGIKSVECIRLLTLQQKAFPIDTNAGRVAVRLGWIPLQPLPEGQAFHLLKVYPKVNSVQKYIWPRVSELDVSVQYELHCHMITFAKVFCKKKNPNCKACPMRAECKHYASTLASSRRPALPGIPEEDTRSGNKANCTTSKCVGETETVPYVFTKHQPKVEFSKSHALELERPTERDIEDFGLDEVSRVMIDVEKLNKSMQNFVIEKNLREGEVQSLMLLTSETAPIPVPIFKNRSHVRTEHQVYVLPDSHHILAGFPKREDNDLCPYLFAAWTPESLNKDEYTPEEKIVHGTVLIPTRTAVHGAFPLNGTYFQANEVFADDESSESPTKLPWESIWNLPRTTLYCGKNISALCRGMETFEVQECFWRGFVCFRGFDRKTREPRALSSKFHLSVCKPETTRVRTKETAVEHVEKKSGKARGRPKKAAVEHIEKEPEKPRGRRKKTTVEHIDREPDKPRGRRKKMTVEPMDREPEKTRDRRKKTTVELIEREPEKTRGRRKKMTVEHVEKEPIPLPPKFLLPASMGRKPRGRKKKESNS